MSDQKESLVKQVKELIEMVSAAVRWGALVIGALCLLIYMREIGQFPEGINLGEGLAFYLVCLGFALFYAIHWVGLTALGCLIVGKPLSYLLRHFHRKRPLISVDLSPMWGVYVMLVAFSVNLPLLPFYIRNNLQLWALFLAAICQGLFVVIVLSLHRQHIHLQSGLLVSSDEVRSNTKKSLLVPQYALISWLVVLPWIVGPNQTFMVNTAFSFAKLRKENATIHVQKPWSTRVAQSTLKSSESFLGENYMRFDNVKVLLRSVGQNVVIELPQADDNPSSKLPVPSTHILVE